MNLPLTLSLLVATCFLHSYLITDVWQVLPCFLNRYARTLEYRYFISLGASSSAFSREECLFEHWLSSVLGSLVPSFEENDLSSVDSCRSITTNYFGLSIFGDFLILYEFWWTSLGLGHIRVFLGLTGSLNVFLNSVTDIGKVGIIFP